MNQLDKQYINLCTNVLNTGLRKSDRTGTGTISLFGATIRVNLQDGFPLLTTKSVHFKSVVTELLWFLKGDTNTQYLKEQGNKIWQAWETPDGEIGPMYGKQWRKWSGYNTRGEFKEIDQIKELVDIIIRDPDSRRMLVSAWNVADLPNRGVTPQGNAEHGYMALAPCHHSFQCYVSDGKLSMLVNQRSADLLLGVPFNIASYAILTHMLAQVTNLQVGELIWNGGDIHIYSNHINQVEEQIERFNRGEVYPLPQLGLSADIKHIDMFELRDISLDNYQHAGKIAAPVAI